jgi:large subunit ribosomal protein L22
MKTFKKNLRHTPRKLRLVVDSIRQLSPQEALNQLAFSPKHAAKPLIKAIKEAIANAQNLDPSINVDNLRFKKIQVDEGIVFKRFIIAGRGRIKPYKKRTAHLDLQLELQTKPKVETPKSAPKKSAKKINKSKPKK